MAYITDGRIVKNFSLAEMTNKQAKDNIKLVLTPEVVEHAQMMQELRDYYGPLTVSSWYRTPSFNRRPEVRGASNSAHLDGRATDITNITASRFEEMAHVWRSICINHGKVGGVEFYDWGVHFDSHSDKFGFKTFRVVDNRR